MSSALVRGLLEDLRENPELAGEFAEVLRAARPDLFEGSAGAPDRWLSTKDAAVHLGMHEVTLSRLAAQGLVPSEQDGPRCKRRFLRSQLDQWLRMGGTSQPKATS